ncbi:hypothetical protein CK203_017312 [Vitis vinifera]|uniref:Uncharacterized protein n=1 Tax=Vitis vinifera TaxID=29760 RepID=A0A438JZU9_VITVI|nr:hypothetical protein CK203_017312 [Vitis vinifera]
MKKTSVKHFKAQETKTAESSLDRTSKGSIGSLAVGAFNAWQVTVASTGHRPDLDRTRVRLDREEKATGRERRFLCLPRPDLDRTRETGRPVTQPVEPVGHSLDRMSLLALKTYPFLFLSFPILRQGL